ncbi:MAG TPA: PadR family transcriptional regulator [Candidatus Agrococcus pullicola]|uniref:PadR family transcriptional regulator n=1 Tax=Candidatus Agrococcus pullicola TaxID=2838429 RepID=A0A9D1YWG4_9MICO|nr:PadR family transcriptional regulator [Candidatus Agrococcus pullicola]
MLSSDLVRSTIDLVILSVLTEGPSYGYAIAKRVDEISQGEYVTKETTLYAAIRRLEQRGLLDSYAGTESGGRARTYYRLTPDGEAQLQTRTSEWRAAHRIVTRFLEREGNTP